MNPLEAIKICVVKKPLSFRGTASKSELWGFALPYALFLLGSYTLSEKTIAIKKQLEAKLHTTFDVITEEQTINERLKHGHFKSYN